jgi:rieske iron-sulfur protein
VVSDDPSQPSRRKVLVQVGAGVGLGLAGASLLTVLGGFRPKVETTPETSPPQPGDLLVLARGAEGDHILRPDDVPAGAQEVFAWPMEPGSKVVRSGDSQNLILLVRASEEQWFSSQTHSNSALRVAAYSAICTHLCCQVSGWSAEAPGAAEHGALLCRCHMSYFNPWDGARVLGGPAHRPLPALPLETNAQGQLVVRSGFVGRAGCST